MSQAQTARHGPFASLFSGAPFELPTDCVGLYVNDERGWRGLAVFDDLVPLHTFRVQWDLRFVDREWLCAGCRK